MITLIHGDDIEKSRAYLNDLVNAFKDKEVRRIDGRSVDVTNLTTLLGSVSMLGRDQVVITENLLSSSLKKPTRLAAFLQILTHAPKQNNIIVWENRELTKSAVSKLGDEVKVSLFKVPVVLFQFLDAIAPSRVKLLIELYHKLRATQADELIFYLMTRRFRQLLLLRDGGRIEDLAPWQASRLTTQAKHFTLERLRQMYKQLLTLEYSLKSGRTPFSLDGLIEQFLMSL